ncbi:AraC family transcriptional regulator ligand-binding domain-containing protein [Alicycliphilus sp. T452]
MSYRNFARSPVSIRLLLDFGQARNIDAASLLQGTKLDISQLTDPELTVSTQQELTVASNLLKFAGDEPEMGFRVGLSYHLSAYGLLGYGMLSSATGGRCPGARQTLFAAYLCLYQHCVSSIRQSRRTGL